MTERDRREIRGGRAECGREHGAAAVEFAILATVLLLFMFGIIEFSRLMASNNAVETAAREAARYGSSVGTGSAGVPRYADCAGIRAAAKRLADTTVNLADSDIQVTYDRGPGTLTTATCPAGGILLGLVQEGDRIVVSVNSSFSSGVPLVSEFLDGNTMSATDRRTIHGVSL